ncbi:MAG: hypothetical protein KF763_00960 [Cyclobacteriaceae bacterium]|nr:hypothetical protein [Cyclobacteriaceae bacterium]
MSFPLVTFELRDQYLLVIGHGVRNSLADMVHTASLIINEAQATGSNKMLVDYRQLDIQVRITEAFNIVKTYEQNLPALRNMVVAAVFESRHRTFASYWQEVSSKRGFTIKTFEDFEEAEKWLIGQDYL